MFTLAFLFNVTHNLLRNVKDGVFVFRNHEHQCFFGMFGEPSLGHKSHGYIIPFIHGTALHKVVQLRSFPEHSRKGCRKAVKQRDLVSACFPVLVFLFQILHQFRGI